MYTSAECRAYAEEKLAQAEHDSQHRNRLYRRPSLAFARQSIETTRSVLQPQKTFKENYGVVDRAERALAVGEGAATESCSKGC